MDHKVRTMLENMYDKIQARTHDRPKSWDHLVEFLAASNSAHLFGQAVGRLDWILKDSTLVKSLSAAYDAQLLRSDYHDHLGDMYLEKLVTKDQAQNRGQFLTPENVAGMMSQMAIPTTEQPLNILDPAVGTGRLLMAAHKQAPNARLFGVDIDLRMVRIALANFAIHDIPGYVLHANALEHVIDIATEEGRHNWQYANKWDSQMDRLKRSHEDPNYSLQLQPGQKRPTED